MWIAIEVDDGLAPAVERCVRWIKRRAVLSEGQVMIVTTPKGLDLPLQLEHQLAVRILDMKAFEGSDPPVDSAWQETAEILGNPEAMAALREAGAFEGDTPVGEDA
jgi:hypothetical protein